jgi:hypothetical protein
MGTTRNPDPHPTTTALERHISQAYHRGDSMTRVRRLSLCSAMLGLSVTVFTQVQLPAPAGGGQPSPGTGLLAGRIVDAGGSPVAAVIVGIRRSTPTPAPGRGGASLDRVLTDDAGRFVFSGLAAGRYEIDATKPGWLGGAPGRRRPGGVSMPLELANGERRNDLSISIWRAGAIVGRAIGDNGDPLVGVEVRAMRQTFIAGRRQSETPIRAKTDDRGAFRFSGLMPGSYLVAVLSNVLSEPEGFSGAMSAVGDRAYLQTMTAIGVAPILFERAGGVTGANRPLVETLGQMPSVPNGDGAWLMYPTTYYPASTTLEEATIVRLTSGEFRADVDVHVKLAPTWQVSGTLRDAQGPAAWHAVHLIPAETPDFPLVDVSTAVTDAKGAFTFYGVPPGQYIARVVRAPWPSGPGQRFAQVGGTGQIPSIGTVVGGPNAGPPFAADPLMHVSEPVSVGSRHVRDLTLVMREGPRVRGRVRFEGSAPPPAAEQLRTVAIFVQQANGRMDSSIFPGRFGTDGQTFSSSSLVPGKYLVRPAALPGWTLKEATHQGRDVSESPLDVSSDVDGVVITFVDQARTLSGTVQGEVGKPVGGSVVLLFPAESPAWVDYGRTSRRVTSTVAGVMGTFSFAMPPEGEYFLIAVPDELAEDWQNPETLAKLAPLAERVRIGAGVPPALSLQVRRFR